MRAKTFDGMNICVPEEFVFAGLRDVFQDLTGPEASARAQHSSHQEGTVG